MKIILVLLELTALVFSIYWSIENKWEKEPIITTILCISSLLGLFMSDVESKIRMNTAGKHHNIEIAKDADVDMTTKGEHHNIKIK